MEPLAIKQAREWCEQIGSPLWPNMNESDWATLMRDVLAEYEIISKALREIETMPPPMPNKSAAVAQCHYLKDIARGVLQ